MRYLISLLMVLMLTLVGCSNSDQNQDKDDTENVESKTVEKQEDGEEQTSDFARFHNIDFLLGVDDVKITGQAEATNNEVFYEVAQGDETIIAETKIPLEHKDEDWTKFEFEFDLTEEMESSEDALVVVFYGKDDGDQIINSNYLPIDFNMQFNTESN
ncbi:MAG TPA: Gmad2 immunoglobulin-like domain-containing protein [Candidatus Dormibacteraeota bacterium]|nr:Gmad2 immunoglobulin-like domain-containing protein [Candidatus Dormibacteraeota bacterium]